MSLTGPQRSELEAYVTKLTADDRSDRGAAFGNGVRQNVRGWEELAAMQPKACRWALLEAYVARISVTEDPREVFYAEKLAWARERLQQLLREDGEAFAADEPHRARLVLQLLGRAPA